ETTFRFEDSPPRPERRSLAAWLIGGGSLAVLVAATVVALSMGSEEGPPSREGERIAAKNKEKSEREKEKPRPEEQKPPEQTRPEKPAPKSKPRETDPRPPAPPPREKPPTQPTPVQTPPEKPPDKPPPVKPTVGLVHTLRGHTEFIHCVAVTPD